MKELKKAFRLTKNASETPMRFLLGEVVRGTVKLCASAVKLSLPLASLVGMGKC